MLSIITCSINPEKLAQLSQSLAETTELPYELIVIENKGHNYGICQAYNLGAAQSKFAYLCFVHEDIIFKNKGWDQHFVAHFETKEIAMIGILGNTIKTKYPSGVYSAVQHTNRINQLQLLPDGSSIHYYNNPLEEKTSEVATLDGMLLGTLKTYWLAQKFDENLAGFHAYDVDYSLAMRQMGKVAVVYDILIAHASFGGNTRSWIDNQLQTAKKWRHILPIRPKDHDSRTLRLREQDDLRQFSIALLKLNYRYRLALYYGLLTLLSKPFQRVNLFIVKQLILQFFSWPKPSTSSPAN